MVVFPYVVCVKVALGKGSLKNRIDAFQAALNVFILWGILG
jgi:hypothetical protein